MRDLPGWGERLKMRVKRFIRDSRRDLTVAARIAAADIRTNYLGQTFPLKPTSLNLLANDICNSRCQMCLVWQQKRDKEFAPAELAVILADPLFSELQYVGVSGGEPTLRGDLPDIYRVLMEKRPRLHGTGIITNAIRPDNVIDRISASAQVCCQAGVPFNVMVSLDGIGEVHDRVRGREGNFESAVAVIRHFRDETDIPLAIGCTVTKDNVWCVDEVLDFCRSEGVPGRFRVAEFIQRLYNDGQAAYIRSFTERETYHLGLFFAKLEYTYEKSSERKRVYRNIRRMLMEGAERSIGCYWQSRAVTLDCRGQLLYCAPRSPVLGSCLEHSAQALYVGNIEQRKHILKNACKSCIHDYHSGGTLKEWLSSREEQNWHRRLSLNNALEMANRYPTPRVGLPGKQLTGQFLIVGWYGTETAGDKAILGEIIYQLKQQTPGARIVLASLYPYLSSWTLRELGYTDVRVIPTYSADFEHHVRAAGEVIMGGGPLMHLEELGFVLWAFMAAKQAGHRTRIAGCGIGPLDRGQKYEEAVGHILRLADVVELRDAASVAWARQLVGREDMMNSGDYAAGFVRRWRARHAAGETGPFLNLYLREWPLEYRGELTEEQFKAVRCQFEDQLGQWVRALCDQFDLHPRLLPMHHFCLGDDDRDFNRRFSRAHLSGLEPIVEREPLSPQAVLASMQTAHLCLCMRFHSVLFADTLEVPFVAIDYTGGGKIAGYLADRGKLDRAISLHDVVGGAWRRTLAEVQAEVGLGRQTR